MLCQIYLKSLQLDSISHVTFANEQSFCDTICLPLCRDTAMSCRNSFEFFVVTAFQGTWVVLLHSMSSCAEIYLRLTVECHAMSSVFFP